MKERILQMLNSKDREMLNLGIILALTYLSREDCLKIRTPHSMESDHNVYYIQTNWVRQDRAYIKEDLCMYIGGQYLHCVFYKDIEYSLSHYEKIYL